MINKIKSLDEKKAKALLEDFMEIYLDKGFGVMNKTEIEILMYHVFKKHELLTGKCFDDSFKLQITEAKARKLIYDAQVKYADMDENKLADYLRTSVGNCLVHAFFSKSGKEIRFAIEDKYLRVALNAKLRENYYFADTSFNKDIISLDENAFREMILLLVPNYQKVDVLNRFKDLDLLEESTAQEYVKDIIKDIIKKIFVKGTIKGVVELGRMMLAAV